MKRPKTTEDYVIKSAAEDFVTKLMRWADAGESERLTYLEDATGVMKCAGYKNGYEMARDLERKGYEPDAALVELLDDASFHLRSAHERAVKEWVKGWNIKVPFHVGQETRLTVSGKVVTGKITRIDEEQAQCLVCCPELGHVESGLGTHGLIINYEQLVDSDSAVSKLQTV